MLLRLTDARIASKVDLPPQPTPWRIGVDNSGASLPLARRCAVTADLVAAALDLAGQSALPAADGQLVSVWVGGVSGPDGAIWVQPDGVTGEFGGIDDASWRVLCLQQHYRAPLAIDSAARGRARTSLLRLQRAYRNLLRVAPGGSPSRPLSVQSQRLEGQLHAALLDDLATPEALSIVAQVLEHDIEPGEQLHLLLGASRLLGLALT